MKWLLSFFISMFLINSTIKAQELKKIESLDDFFAGIPLKKGFNAWVDYIAAHPYLGIDSIGDRGGYSSFKPGIENYFPFPDSVFVKILLSKDINPRTGDTALAVSIEGVFSDNKAGRKASELFYKQIKRKLDFYYRSWTDRLYELLFSDGINDSFPNFTLAQGYAAELKFYFVIIRYEYF